MSDPLDKSGDLIITSGKARYVNKYFNKYFNKYVHECAVKDNVFEDAPAPPNTVYTQPVVRPCLPKKH